MATSPSPNNRAVAMARPFEEPGGPREAARGVMGAETLGAFALTFLAEACPCVECEELVDIGLGSPEYCEAESDAKPLAIDEVEDLRRLEGGCDEETETLSALSLNEPIFCFLSFLVGVSMTDGEGGRFPFPFESFFLDFAFCEPDTTSSGKSTYGDPGRSSIFALADRAPRRDPVEIPIQVAK